MLVVVVVLVVDVVLVLVVLVVDVVLVLVVLVVELVLEDVDVSESGVLEVDELYEPGSVVEVVEDDDDEPGVVDVGDVGLVGEPVVGAAVPGALVESRGASVLETSLPEPVVGDCCSPRGASPLTTASSFSSTNARGAGASSSSLSTSGASAAIAAMSAPELATIAVSPSWLHPAATRAKAKKSAARRNCIPRDRPEVLRTQVQFVGRSHVL